MHVCVLCFPFYLLSPFFPPFPFPFMEKPESKVRISNNVVLQLASHGTCRNDLDATQKDVLGISQLFMEAELDIINLVQRL